MFICIFFFSWKDKYAIFFCRIIRQNTPFGVNKGSFITFYRDSDLPLKKWLNRLVRIKTTPSSRKPAEARPDRTLSAEEEKANEEAFEQKQIKHQERVAEQEEKAPTPPSETEQERIDERAKRRAEAEKRKIENIRKREAKAAEYERQLKLREEQKAQGLVNQLNP